MRTRTAFAFCGAFGAVSAVSAQTSISWVDMSHGANPSLTTAFIAKDGWEFWAFGANNSDARDLELGRLYPVGKRWLVGGYGVIWPASGKVFGLPFAMYQDDVLGGHLRLKLGSYLPLNGGPTILFSDESSLLWRARKGISWGPILSYSQVGDAQPTVRLGLTLRLTKGTTGLELSCQPVYLSNRGLTSFRIGITQGF